MKYLDLVEKVKQHYSVPIPGGTYLKKDKIAKATIKEDFQLKWCEGCEEINLWTYWQGHKNKSAKILLIGQDWASPWESIDGPLYEYIQDILAGDTDCSKKYIEEINKKKFPTDMMLQELMKSLGEAYDPFLADNSNLFFTNLCLGYRDHGSSSGLNKKVLLHDVQYIEELIGIVNPKIVVCLGKDTYDAMVKGTGSIPVFLLSKNVKAGFLYKNLCTME